MRRALLLLAVGACGDNLATDAGAPDATVTCAATFSGNFAETSAASRCAAVDPDGTLALTIPSQTLPPSLDATIDLGASPSAGAYSSEVVSSWSARGIETVGSSVCLYNAGASAVPPGDFALRLDQIDTAAGVAHGAITMTIYVLPFPGTDCGDGDVEHVAVEF